MIHKLILFIIGLLMSGNVLAKNCKDPLIIAHRGASGYLPEHTLASKALAYGMGADYLEQDVVMSRDDQLIVSHDIHLDTISDVAKIFPERKRADGQFYFIDFTLAELRKLNLNERRKVGSEEKAYPSRFAPSDVLFPIVTLDEELAFIRDLNRSTGREVGAYVEIKQPEFHFKEGKNIAKAVIDLLKKHGYTKKSHPVYVQCFHQQTLRELRKELNTKLKLVQLIGDNSWKESSTDYDFLRTKPAVIEMSGWVDAVGVQFSHLFTYDGNTKTVKTTEFFSYLRDAHLPVHAYTFRKEDLPSGIKPETFMQILFNDLKIAGLFTDFPNLRWNCND